MLQFEIAKKYFKNIIANLIFFAESTLVRAFCTSCALSDSIVFLICACVYAILFGLMILSFCGCIYARDSVSSLLTLKNAVFFLKMFSGGILAIVAVCIAAFSPVNTRGGRTWLIIVPKGVTDMWERRIFSVILFLFIPLYALIFIQMYEAMLEKDI